MKNKAVSQTTYFTPLIESCKQGNPKAQEKLYGLYEKAMHNIAFKITKDYMDAEDVVQESFIRAFKNLHHYKGQATFGAWLKRIVINTAINQLKKKKVEFVDVNDICVKLAEGPTEYKYCTQNIEQIYAAISALPEGYRSVLSLYLLEGYDHAEISKILGISEATSKSQFCRAKKKLRKWLGCKKHFVETPVLAYA